jgi:Zn-dependent peptidase ImmA (M78 family)
LGADKASACRSRFDAAHELAHMIVHRSVPKSAYTPKEAFKLMEDQANLFASAFLLPEGTFTKECTDPTLDGLLTLKTRWRVSVGAMIMRLAKLGLVSPEQEQRLWINRSRRRWRTTEPLDDIMEPEQPRFLRRCFEVLISKGVMSAVEVPFHLGLPSRDIEQLAGLRPGYLESDEQNVTLTDDAVQEAEERARIIRFTQVS